MSPIPLITPNACIYFPYLALAMERRCHCANSVMVELDFLRGEDTWPWNIRAYVQKCVEDVSVTFRHPSTIHHDVRFPIPCPSA